MNCKASSLFILNGRIHILHIPSDTREVTADYFISINYVCSREQQRTHLILNGKEHSVLIQKKTELAGYQE